MTLETTSSSNTHRTRNRTFRIGLVGPIGLMYCAMACLAFAAEPGARTPSAADQAFAKGVQAFQAGHLADALTAFENARRLGRRDSHVYYNLGSVYYRLRRFDQAKNNFHLAARFPDAQALSWYNLGLVAVQQDRLLDAIEWFERVAALSGPDPVRRLAGDARDWARRQLAAGPQPWFQLQAGYNDNVVALGDAVEFELAGQGAQFLEGALRYDGRRRGLGSAGARGRADFYFSNFSGLSTANVRVGQLGLLLDWPTQNGLWDLLLLGGHSWYGGDDYQDFHELLAQYGLQRGRLRGRVGYRVTGYRSREAAAPGLEGTRRRGLLDVGLWFDHWRVSGGYSRETNSRDSPDFSPRRDEWRAGLQFLPSRRNTFELMRSWRDSTYEDGATVTRRDELSTLDVVWTYRWPRGGFFRLALQENRNASDDPKFAFTQHIYSAGVGLSYW